MSVQQATPPAALDARASQAAFQQFVAESFARLQAQVLERHEELVNALVQENARLRGEAFPSQTAPSLWKAMDKDANVGKTVQNIPMPIQVPPSVAMSCLNNTTPEIERKGRHTSAVSLPAATFKPVLRIQHGYGPRVPARYSSFVDGMPVDDDFMPVEHSKSNSSKQKMADNRELRSTMNKLTDNNSSSTSLCRPGCIRSFFRCSSEMEAMHLDLNKLCAQRYGPEARWPDIGGAAQADIIRDALRRKQFLIDPDTEYVKVWDLVLILALGFTAIATPFEIALLNSSYGALYVVNKLVDVIFIKDMVMQFFMKIRKESDQGTVWIKDRAIIARVYLRTWFLVDLLSIIPYDELSVLFFDGKATVRYVRVVRVLRLAKLVRMFKASKILKRWEHRLGLSSANRALVTFALLIFLSIHWFACLWGFFAKFGGDNLQCREDLELHDSRLYNFPNTMYFFIDVANNDPHDPEQWSGVSWYVNFVQGRIAGTSTNPCLPSTVYIVSMYWAVMTLTSIGYGDVLPVTFSEYVVCNVCMLLTSVVWAYIIGAACAVLSNMDPEQKDFERRMDAFNSMAIAQSLPQDVRVRGREYIRAERFHQHVLRNRAAMAALGNNLRDTCSRRLAAQYFDKVWFFARSGSDFRDATAETLTPNFFEAREIVQLFGHLCIVERGSVGRKGRILVPWNYWGDDMLVRSPLLHARVLSITLSHTEIMTLSREALCKVLVEFPEEIKSFRRMAALVALRRAMELCIEMSGSGTNGKQAKLSWVTDLFDKTKLRDKPQGDGAPEFGETRPTVEERLDLLTACVQVSNGRSGSKISVR